MAKLQIPTYVTTIYCWRKKRTSVKSPNSSLCVSVVNLMEHPNLELRAGAELHGHAVIGPARDGGIVVIQ